MMIGYTPVPDKNTDCVCVALRVLSVMEMSPVREPRAASGEKVTPTVQTLPGTSATDVEQVVVLLLTAK